MSKYQFSYCKCLVIASFYAYICILPLPFFHTRCWFEWRKDGCSTWVSVTCFHSLASCWHFHFDSCSTWPVVTKCFCLALQFFGSFSHMDPFPHKYFVPFIPRTTKLKGILSHLPSVISQFLFSPTFYFFWHYCVFIRHVVCLCCWLYTEQMTSVANPGTHSKKIYNFYAGFYNKFSGRLSEEPFPCTLRSWIVVPTGINVPTGQMMEIQLTYLPE